MMDCFSEVSTNQVFLSYFSIHLSARVMSTISTKRRLLYAVSAFLVLEHPNQRIFPFSIYRTRGSRAPPIATSDHQILS